MGTRRAVALGVFLGMLGCQAHAPEAPAETVGTLAAGPSVWHAPTHATTDFGHAQIVETTDDAQTDTATTEAPAELPEVAPKTDGVTTGEVR